MGNNGLHGRFRSRVRLRRNPTHHRYRADGVLGASFDHTVAVRHVDEYVARFIEEAHDVQALENQTPALFEYRLAVLQVNGNLNGAHLPAGDAGIAGVFGESQFSLDAASDRAADMAGDAANLRVIESVHDDPVIG